MSYKKKSSEQLLDENKYNYHLDHLGTPIMLTDSNQAIAWDATYDPFGKATVTTATITNNLRFPGQYYDAETGLHYNYYRYYWSDIGRYMTPDILNLGTINLLSWQEAIGRLTRADIMNVGGERILLNNPLFQNPYSYSLNNSVNITDPLGIAGGYTSGRNTLRRIWPSCSNCATPLFNAAVKKFGMGNSTSSDRHCWASCEICKQCGTACCFVTGWGNEIAGIRGGGFDWNDVKDNARGRGCAGSNQDCDKCCKQTCLQ